MRTVTALTAAVAALAAAAAGTVYVAEDFEGTFPPDGWTTDCTSYGWWTKMADGPTGAYARGQVGVSPGTARADLITYAFAVDANETVYYRFDYAHGYGGYPSTWGADFYLVYADPPNEVITQETVRTGNWREHAASAVAPRAGSARAFWRVRVYCSWRWAGVIFDVDNAGIADQPDVGVAPASLGRVKTLFR
jgi:hypothetical protein